MLEIILNSELEMDQTLWRYFNTNRDRAMDKHHQYFPAYERHLSPFAGRSVLMLEIGVQNGGSTQMWKRYLGPYAQIVGVDVNPACAQVEEPGIAIRIGSQSDPGLIKSIIDEFGVPDIVLDDGSHVMTDINATFDMIFPLQPLGSVYLVEDLHCAYWKKFGGGLHAKESFINRAKKMVDDMHAHYLSDELQPDKNLANISSIHFYDSIVVIEKNRVSHSRMSSFTGSKAAVWMPEGWTGPAAKDDSVTADHGGQGQACEKKKLVLHNSHPGMLSNPWGNAMLKLLVFVKIQSSCRQRDVHFSNLSFSSWNIDFPSLQPEPTSKSYVAQHVHYVDVEDIIARADSGEIDWVDFPHYCQRFEYLPPLDVARKIFYTDQSCAHPALKGSILCPVRGAEILKPIHPHYVLIPVAYYQRIAEETGKPLVFCGQLGQDVYSQALISAFPDAEIIPSRDPYTDFGIILSAEETILSVSTFVWLASWLSKAKRIYMPVVGFYNNRQDPLSNFIPAGDDRYVYDLFPVTQSCELVDLPVEHERLMSSVRRINVASEFHLLSDNHC